MKPLDPLTVALAGTNLIEASAGTGKTHTITNLYLRLLLELRLSVGQILVVTYTNAATAELRARVRDRLRQALAAFEAGGNGDDDFLDRLVAARREAGMLEQDRVQLVVALHGFDEAAIFTIHGFCQRMLQENAFESGVAFDTELITNQSPLLTEVVQDFWVRELHAAPPDFVHHLAESKTTPTSLEQLATRVIAHPDMPVLPTDDGESPDDDLDARVLRLRLDFIGYARRELRRRKERARTQSFDDLLYRLAEALRGPGGAYLAETIRQRFRAALIDEFQDTDPVQYEIFRRAYRDGDAVLFLIGDPKQAIYAFRGADVFAYIQAKHDAAGAPRTIDVNYRSDPSLVAAVNALFGRLQQPFVFADIPFIRVKPAPGATDRLGGGAAGEPPLHILLVDPATAKTRGRVINKGWGETELPRFVAAEIVRFLGSGATIGTRPVAPSDVAVLCRKNKQAAMMQEALRDLGVPTVLETEASVFETPEAEEVERVLLALADPGDARAIRAALCTRMMGENAAGLRLLDQEEQRWDEWVARFQRWSDLWTQRGFVAAFRALLDAQGVQPRLLALLDGERRLTNVLHLLELLHAASTEERRGPQALVQWLAQMRTDVDSRAALAGEAAQIRLESDAAAVKLTTVHKSKGLQYPIVYCPFLWDGALLGHGDKDAVRFHDPDDGNRLKLDIGSAEHDAHEALAETEAFAENLRLLYVALTRARHSCTVVWGGFYGAEHSALGYVLHQPAAAETADEPKPHPSKRSRTARPEGPPSSGDVSKGARWTKSPLPAPDAVRQATAIHIKSLFSSRDDADVRAEIEALAATAPDCIGVGTLSVEPVARYTPPAGATPTLACRSATRELRPIWRVSSFSALAASGARLSLPAEEGLDHDAAVETGAAGATAPAVATPIVLHEFPRGARAGQLVHQVLEDLDFAADAQALAGQVRRTIHGFGFDDVWAEPLARALADVLGTDLGAGASPLRLRDVPLARRTSELEFMLPVAGEPSADLLTAKRIAAVLARHAAAPVPPDYAARVAALGFGALAGFLRGFIDLVFERDGRWYLVDYKSNMLGPRPQDYEPERLLGAMSEHHYFLQYHLYVVALHRHLASRLPDYDYERDFGGVRYLFLRGMAPRYRRHNGVFRDRPSRALIESLSDVLAGRQEAP